MKSYHNTILLKDDKLVTFLNFLEKNKLCKDNISKLSLEFEGEHVYIEKTATIDSRIDFKDVISNLQMHFPAIANDRKIRVFLKHNIDIAKLSVNGELNETTFK